MKRIFILLLILIPSIASAWGKFSDKTVKKVHVNLTSGVYFQTHQDMENPDGCTESNLYHLKRDSGYEKEALSVLLSAKMAGDKVQFYLNGCENGYPSVSYINVYD